MLEPFAIGAERGIVINTARHVSPMAGRDLAVCSLLEIEDIEGPSRITNDLGDFLGLLGEATLPEEGGHSPERSDIGARRQKLEKFATGGEGGLAHGGC